jgi:hypothetical protein
MRNFSGAPANHAVERRALVRPQVNAKPLGRLAVIEAFAWE